MKNSTQNILMLSIILLAVLASGFFYGLYDIRTKNQDTLTILDSINQDSGGSTLVQSVRLLQNEQSEGVLLLDTFVLSSERLVALIEDIEKAGRNFGLDVSISSVDKVDTVGQERLRLEVEGEGSWAANNTFLKTLESLPNRPVMESVTLRKAEDFWRSRIIFSLYSFN